MAVDWSLGIQQTNPLNAFMGGYQHGQEVKRQRDTQNALAAYVQNPGADTLNAIAPFNPEFVVHERGRMAQEQRAQAEAQQGDLQRRLEMVARVASMADTPEKWDAGVDYLVQQGYADLAQYKGQFSPELRATAIASATDPQKYQEMNRPVNLGPGSMLVDPNTGKTIASAPFAPRPVTLSEGQTAVEYNPAQMDAGDVFSRMIHTESRGNQFGANGQPLTSSAGAIGIAQVMPGTAPEAARLAGVPFDENRYRTDPEYNAMLGRAYFDKQMSDFGNVEMAVAAYNAGPGRVQQAVQRGGENWKDFLPQETKDYLRSVLGGGQGRVIGRGADKPKWRTLSPQEVQQRGLPAGSYQVSPAGEVKPIAAPKANGEPAPGSPAYSQSAIDAFNRAIDSAQRLMNHPGMSDRVGVKGVTGGLLGGWVVPGTEAANFDAELEAMKAQVFLPMVQSMKGMGALSNAEGDRLTASIGALNPNMSESAFRSSLNRIIRDLVSYRDRGAQQVRQQPTMQAPSSRNNAPRVTRPTVSNW